jgi:hypothetical protein
MAMANLQKRGGSRLSRSERQSRAFRVVQVGSVTGVGFVVTTVLAIAGVIGATIPVVLLLATLAAGYRFLKLTGQR